MGENHHFIEFLIEWYNRRVTPVMIPCHLDHKTIVVLACPMVRHRSEADGNRCARKTEWRLGMHLQ